MIWKWNPLRGRCTCIGDLWWLPRWKPSVLHSLSWVIPLSRVKLIVERGDFGIFLSGIMVFWPELAFSRLNRRDLGGVWSSTCFVLSVTIAFSLSLRDVFSNSLVANAFFRVSTWKQG
jgi:hypothetical protein